MSAVVVSWVLVVFGLVGTVMNARQDRRCFYIWAPSNLGLAGYNWLIGQQALALLFFVYFCLALYGLHQWQRRKVFR